MPPMPLHTQSRIVDEMLERQADYSHSAYSRMLNIGRSTWYDVRNFLAKPQFDVLAGLAAAYPHDPQLKDLVWDYLVEAGRLGDGNC